MTDRADLPIDPYSLADDVLGEAIEAETDEAPEKQTRREALMNRVLTNRDLAITLVAIAIFAFFSIAGPRFLSSGNLIDLARRAAILGVIGTGLTFLFVAGELDLSVGSHYGFLLILISFQDQRWGFDLWVASLVVIIVGILIGAVNGILVTRVGLPSFITTLGMLALLRGASNTLSGGYPIPTLNMGLPFFLFIRGNFPGTLIPNLFLIMVVVMIIGGVILAKTRFGSDVYATGGDVEAARNNGVNTRRVKMLCFMGVGGLCGLAAAMLYGRVGLAPLSAGVGLELQVIAAIIIGGTGLFGGRGTIYGSFIGVLILGMLSAGIIIIGIPAFWDGVATGLIILLAAGLDLIVRRNAARLLTRTAK